MLADGPQLPLFIPLELVVVECAVVVAAAAETLGGGCDRADQSLVCCRARVCRGRAAWT